MNRGRAVEQQNWQPIFNSYAELLVQSGIAAKSGFSSIKRPRWDLESRQNTRQQFLSTKSSLPLTFQITSSPLLTITQSHLLVALLFIHGHFGSYASAMRLPRRSANDPDGPGKYLRDLTGNVPTTLDPMSIVNCAPYPSPQPPVDVPDLSAQAVDAFVSQLSEAPSLQPHMCRRHDEAGTRVESATKEKRLPVSPWPPYSRAATRTMGQEILRHHRAGS
jgi:hypothetical protein